MVPWCLPGRSCRSPGRTISGRGRDREFGDGLRKLPGWFDSSEADLKASELDRVLGKHELLGFRVMPLAPQRMSQLAVSVNA